MSPTSIAGDFSMIGKGLLSGGAKGEAVAMVAVSGPGAGDRRLESWIGAGGKWRRGGVLPASPDGYSQVANVTFFGGRYFAVGQWNATESAALWVSRDGKSWSRKPTPGIPAENSALVDVVGAAGKIVLIAGPLSGGGLTANRIYYSGDNGDTWNIGDELFGYFDMQYSRRSIFAATIIDENMVFVAATGAAGAAVNLRASLDFGASWVEAEIAGGGLSGLVIRSVSAGLDAAGRPIFVAAGHRGASPVLWILVSEDGLSWSPVYSKNTVSGSAGAVVYGRGVWLVGGEYHFFTSHDCSAWTESAEPAGLGQFRAAAFSAGKFLVLGQAPYGVGAKILSSINGVAWEAVEQPALDPGQSSYAYALAARK